MRLDRGILVAMTAGLLMAVALGVGAAASVGLFANGPDEPMRWTASSTTNLPTGALVTGWGEWVDSARGDGEEAIVRLLYVSAKAEGPGAPLVSASVSGETGGRTIRARFSDGAGGVVEAPRVLVSEGRLATIGDAEYELGSGNVFVIDVTLGRAEQLPLHLRDPLSPQEVVRQIRAARGQQ